MKFIKDNWLWIAAPILIFTLVVVAIMLFGPDAREPNTYELR